MNDPGDLSREDLDDLDADRVSKCAQALITLAGMTGPDEDVEWSEAEWEEARRVWAHEAVDARRFLAGCDRNGDAYLMAALHRLCGAGEGAPLKFVARAVTILATIGFDAAGLQAR